MENENKPRNLSSCDVCRLALVSSLCTLFLYMHWRRIRQHNANWMAWW